MSGQAELSRPARRDHRAVRLLVDAVGLVATACFLALAVGPHLLDYRTVVMVTGSMRPAADPGDLLVIRPEPLAAVAPGQLLTFSAPLPGSPVITHRVVAVDRAHGAVQVSTRGDANPHADPWQLTLTGTQAWHVVHVARRAGRPVTVLHRPWVRLLTVLVLPFGLCAGLLRQLWRRPGRARPAP